MIIPDPESISPILVECAKTYVLPRYKQLAEHEIRAKTNPRDLVTQADLDVEAHLERVLPDLYPGTIVLGEERLSTQPELMSLLASNEKPVWIVDPIDGTHNFVHHKREFGIMLAYIAGGVTRAAWIYDILGDAIAVAQEGEGAFLDGTRLHVSDASQAKDMTGHINTFFFPKSYAAHLKKAKEQFKACHSLHCAAHEYLRIAKGEAHFSLYSRLKPWDHLPGALIVQEAGGICAKWDSSPYTPQDRDIGLLVASSQLTWNAAYEAFLKGQIISEKE